MALLLQQCASAYAEPRPVAFATFAAFADSLKTPETVTDKRTARTLLPATLREGATEKTLESVATVNALALDFDGVTEEEILRVLKDDLAGYRWVAHTTFSHPEELRTTGRQRWRVWIELSAPVDARSWSAWRTAFDALLSVAVDAQTRNANRLMFAPCSMPGEEAQFEAFDWRDFDALSGAEPIPVDAVASLPTPQAPTPAYVDPASEPVSRDEVKALATSLARRVGEWDQKRARWLKKIVRGDAFVSEQSHEPTMDLARLLADELPHATVQSLADLLAPSLTAMRSLYGSDETPEGFAEKVRSWRKKRAADKARLADVQIPAQDFFGQPPPPPAGEANVNLVTVEGILDASFAQYVHASGVVETYHVTAGQVCVRQDTDVWLHHALFEAMPYDDEGNPLTVRKAQNRIDDWRPLGRAFEHEPEPSRFKSDPGPCFQRLPFDPAPGPTPAWDEFLGRLSSPDTFKAFVWTGFEKRNKGRQVLWLHGHGEDGKSTVLATILGALGAAGTSVGDATFVERFGMSLLDGKRFAVISDCKNPKLLMQEKLRNVTSGDAVIVERKGQDAISKQLAVKLIVASNLMPDITGARADTSRLLLLEVEPAQIKDDPTWQARLTEELPAFLHACRETYMALCPHHGKLPLDAAMQALVTERVESYEEEFEHAAAAWFVFTGNPEDKASAGPVFKRATARGPLEMAWSQPKYEAFKSFMVRKGISFIRIAGKKFYVGVRGKLPDEGAGPRFHAITGTAQ